MINENDRVKLAVLVTEPRTEYKCICSYETAKKVIVDVQNVALEWVMWQGLVNDLDANDLEFCVRRSDIISVDICSGNRM